MDDLLALRIRLDRARTRRRQIQPYSPAWLATTTEIERLTRRIWDAITRTPTGFGHGHHRPS